MINLIVGDWSNDGHGKTDVVSFDTNMSHAEVCLAYSKGSAMIHAFMDNRENYHVPGDILEYVADSYEDNTVPTDIVRGLECFGIKSYNYDEMGDTDTRYLIEKVGPEDYAIADGSESFALLYMEIAKIGNPQLTFKLVQFPGIHIGGYGLFY